MADGRRARAPSLPQALGCHRSGKYGGSADAASGPLQLKAGAASWAIAAKLNARMKHAGIIGKEASNQVWLATRRGGNMS